MKNPENFSATEILSINKPELLFDKNKIKVQFLKLRKIWHPDYCSLPDAGDVFHHIQLLKEQADEILGKGQWNNDSEIEFTTDDEKRYVFRFLRQRDIDVGKMYIGAEKILFMLDKEYEDLFRNAERSITTFPFKDKRLTKEFKQFIPDVIFSKKENGTGFALVIKKSKNVYCLADVIDYFDGKLDPRSVAWIGSGLFNLAAMMEVSGMVHNGLSAESIFIGPEDHTVYLYGGWWYSGKEGTKSAAIPSKMQRVLPKKFFVDKSNKTCYDGFQIKATLIEALGDKSMLGSSLLKGSEVPKPLLSWLRGDDSNRTAIERYADWFKVLEKSFGKRKFIKMEINTTKIYRR
jgi:hypothetical protein